MVDSPDPSPVPEHLWPMLSSQPGPSQRQLLCAIEQAELESPPEVSARIGHAEIKLVSADELNKEENIIADGDKLKVEEQVVDHEQRSSSHCHVSKSEPVNFLLHSRMNDESTPLNLKRQREGKKQTSSSAVTVRPPSRRRVKVSRFCEESYDNEELALIQQAKQNSRISRFHATIGTNTIPEAPTFRPTLEEFRNPIKFIQSVRCSGERHGIIKIIPPDGWSPPVPSFDNEMKFPTKLQAIHTLQEGEDYGDGKDYTFQDFKEMADRYAIMWSEEHFDESISSLKVDQYTAKKIEKLEQFYWRMVDTGQPQTKVEYGNDLDVSAYWSGFKDPSEKHMEETTSWAKDEIDFTHLDHYSKSGWNLKNLPFWPGSILRWFQHKIAGVNVPWLYIGMQFSTFAWHNEDNYMFSINYNHRGAPKIWYGVPGNQDKKFEASIKCHMRKSIKEDPQLLYNITTMVSPAILLERKISVVRLCQNPGEFVVTFPKSYHSGFSAGFNVGEAVNFATPDWILYGRESNEKYRTIARPSVFSFDRMVFMLATYLPDYSLEACQQVLSELRKLYDEEIASRKYILKKGASRLSAPCSLPKSKLSLFDKKASEYDDRRMCCVCKHTCFASAIVCQCSNIRVACLRHWNRICSPKAASNVAHKIYLLCWLSDDDFTSIVEMTEKFISGLKSGNPMSKDELERFWKRFDEV